MGGPSMMWGGVKGGPEVTGDRGGERESLMGLAPRPLSSLMYPGDREPRLSVPGQLLLLLLL